MAEQPNPFESWSDLDDANLDMPDPAWIRGRGDRRRIVRRTAIGSVVAATALVVAGVALNLSGPSTLPDTPAPAHTPTSVASSAPPTSSTAPGPSTDTTAETPEGRPSADPTPSASPDTPGQESSESPPSSTDRQFGPISTDNLLAPDEMFQWESTDDVWQWSEGGTPYRGEGHGPPMFCQTEEFGGTDLWIGIMDRNGEEAFVEAVVQFESETDAKVALGRYQRWASGCAESKASSIDVDHHSGPITVPLPDNEVGYLHELRHPGAPWGEDGTGRNTYVMYGFVQVDNRVMVMTYRVVTTEDLYDPEAQAHAMHDLLPMAWSAIQR